MANLITNYQVLGNLRAAQQWADFILELGRRWECQGLIGPRKVLVWPVCGHGGGGGGQPVNIAVQYGSVIISLRIMKSVGRHGDGSFAC